jgi:PAS domain S-box-containing protein
MAAIVDSSDDAIVSKDLNGIIISWNRSAERIFGYSAAEIIGQSIRRIIPADRQTEEDQVLAAIMRGERVEHFETVRIRKDGRLIPISLTVSPVRDATGTVIGASKIASDISERVAAEAEADRSKRHDVFLGQLMATLTASLDYRKTLTALAVLAVPRIADWCAVDLVEENGTISRLAVSHVDSATPALTQAMQRWSSDPSAPVSASTVIRTTAPVLWTGEHRPARDGDRSDGPWARPPGLASYVCTPMTTSGRAMGALAFATFDGRRAFDPDDLRFAADVAARASMSIEYSQAYEQLQTANRLKDEFLATLSHELRTPLNAIVGYTRMLRSGVVSPERVTHALEVMDRNATALTQIVEDVLDVSRIISGKTRLNVQSVELSSVITDAIGTVAPTADAKGVRIETVLDSDPVVVSGDPDRLQQVVWNLLSNAIKFTPRGGRIQVRLERVNSHVEIVISDTGIGIPAAFLGHIFERFRQAEGGTTRQHGGLGLGLAIARHIVEMHGGTIHAASEGEGRGATFRVMLPVAIVHHEPYLEPVRVHPRAVVHTADPPAIDLTGTHVLAVDDDRDGLSLFRDVLQSAGARVTAVNSAAAALERLEAERPDVLVADIGLPLMDGFELIERVRDLADPQLRRIPAAALTAYARSEDRARALRSGFQMHLSKPVRPAELVAAVAALARSRRE